MPAKSSSKWSNQLGHLFPDPDPDPIQIRSKDAMVQVEVKSLTLGENLGWFPLGLSMGKMGGYPLVNVDITWHNYGKIHHF